MDQLLIRQPYDLWLSAFSPMLQYAYSFQLQVDQTILFKKITELLPEAYALKLFKCNIFAILHCLKYLGKIGHTSYKEELQHVLLPSQTSSSPDKKFS